MSEEATNKILLDKIKELYTPSRAKRTLKGPFEKKSTRGWYTWFGKDNNWL